MLQSSILTLALSASLTLATVTDIPGILPAIPAINPHQIDITPFLKTRPSDFQHPGLWHTHADLEAIRTHIHAGDEPWASSYKAFAADSYSQPDYQMQGPAAVISRGAVSNYTSFANDARAAWQNALMWYITRSQGHWETSTRILDAWGSNLTDIVGTDRSLLVGLDGDLFVNAAEIMRWEGGWREQGASWKRGSGFSVQLYWLFSRQAAVVGQANYGMAAVKALLGFAVFLDDVALWNYAVNAFVNDPCASVRSLFEPRTGQSSESGRDQSHAQSGIGWSALGARVGQSQGVDLYGVSSNILLRGAEYTAKFNQNGTVPYDPKWYRCEAILVNGPWSNISTENFGITENGTLQMWDLLWYQYGVKRGLKAPWTEMAAKKQGPVHLTSNDHPGWGDLLFAY